MSRGRQRLTNFMLNFALGAVNQLLKRMLSAKPKSTQNFYRKTFTLLCFGIIAAIDVEAQEKPSYRTNNYFDVAASAAAGRFSGALSWSHVGNVTRRIEGLKVGYGLRFTSFAGANKFYVTAPSKFTSPVQNLGTIFSETIQENIDTVTTATAVTNSLNLAIYIQYTIAKKIDVGFNIDAIGFSFGPKKQFNIISSSFDPNQPPIVTGAPTRSNLLLTSDNDIGSLNSEFFVRYWVNEKIGVRVGYAFLFSEYQLNRKLSFDGGRIMNDRYRYKASMLMLGISYKPFN
jgi:hypothetical protein